MTQLVNMTHARAFGREQRSQGWCTAGIRAFARRYNLDFDAFCREGIPAEQLEATGDHFALKLVEYARRG